LGFKTGVFQPFKDATALDSMKTRVTHLVTAPTTSYLWIENAQLAVNGVLEKDELKIPEQTPTIRPSQREHQVMRLLSVETRLSSRGVATRRVRLTRLPEVMITQIMRFECADGRVVKIDSRVHIPRTINIAALTSGVEAAKYSLRAVIMHIGGVEAGHYTVVVRSREGYVHCDDADVRNISRAEAQELIDTNAYKAKLFPSVFRHLCAKCPMNRASRCITAITGLVDTCPIYLSSIAGDPGNMDRFSGTVFIEWNRLRYNAHAINKSFTIKHTRSVCKVDASKSRRRMSKSAVPKCKLLRQYDVEKAPQEIGACPYGISFKSFVIHDVPEKIRASPSKTTSATATHQFAYERVPLRRTTCAECDVRASTSAANPPAVDPIFLKNTDVEKCFDISDDEKFAGYINKGVEGKRSAVALEMAKRGMYRGLYIDQHHLLRQLRDAITEDVNTTGLSDASLFLMRSRRRLGESVFFLLKTIRKIAPGEELQWNYGREFDFGPMKTCPCQVCKGACHCKTCQGKQPHGTV
uniref:USP domain-containing protein n=1 Tax=Anisakis simplex TaxID=6269 RepID=A0A0M3KAD0_ANISI